jgi:hypothetical protein
MKNTILPFMLLVNLTNFSMSHAEELPETKAPTLYNDQSIYYISSNSVRVRMNGDKNGKYLGELSLNDIVKVINPTFISAEGYIEIKIVKTYDPIVKSEKYFVKAASLSPKLIDYKEFLGKYFVVVNVATETLRMYERVCADNSCPNKLILETEVVVGEDVDHPKEEKGKGRSVLGSYRITGWSKYYQDPEGHYPAWYRDGYPDVPKANAAWNEWFSRSIMPEDLEGKKHGKMRGAFGWYTAFVEPEAFGQWTHGTLGWGKDQDKFIKKVKGSLINVVSDPRSSGCTRNNNEAIAFLRNMLDVGAPIIKIYAKEEILDPTFSSYPREFKYWNYVLTKNRNHSVDRNKVLKSLGITAQDLEVFAALKKDDGKLILDPNSPLQQILETGTYTIDIFPDAIPFTPGEKLGKFKRKLGRKGNVYGILDIEMHGKFYVDAGMLEGYAHPDAVLESSGFTDEVTPSWMHVSNLK